MPGGIDAIKPAGYAWAVTPSDSADLVLRTRAVYVGTGGNMVCSMVDPTTNKVASVTFTNIASSTVLPIETTRIWSTSTTASGIVALA